MDLGASMPAHVLLSVVNTRLQQVEQVSGLPDAVLQNQVRHYVPCLNAEADKISPAAVVKTSRAMNVAQVFQNSELLGLPPLAIQYQVPGFEALARELIAFNRAEPTSAELDREIIGGWTGKLGNSSWYVWMAP